MVLSGTKEIPSQFASLLGELLEVRYPGMSLRRRAEALEISAPYLSDMLHCKVAPPSARMIKRFAVTLSADELALSRAAQGEVVSIGTTIRPRDVFDFASPQAAAWKWAREAIKQQYTNAGWKERFIDAVALFASIFCLQEDHVDRGLLQSNLKAAQEILRHASDGEQLLSVVERDLTGLFYAPLLFDSEECGTQASERLLIYNALLYSLDPLTYLTTGSPIQLASKEDSTWLAVERYAMGIMK